MRERDRRWIRWFWTLSVEAVLVCALCSAAAADPAQFPRPPQLEPDVQFWQRIYSKVTTQGGLLHDDRFLGIVYEELSFPAGMSPRERAAMVDAAREKYEKQLRRLGGGQRDDLSAEDRRVLALFPSTVTDAELTDAADHLRFQLGQADRFREGLLRSGTWERHVQETLRREGLPPELSALPHVESSFNPRAYSKVGAAGLWQFMRSTGKRWLRVDGTIDERLDPYKSTLAAAQFLNINYAILGSWPLALTAYNHGAGGMRRAKEQMGTDDIVTIVRNYQSRTFGFASRNFYVSFLAALEIDRNPEKFFGRIERSPTDTSRTVRLPVSVSAQALEKTLGTDRETLRSLNLSLLDPVWSGRRTVPRGFELHVPATTDPQKLVTHLGAAEHGDAASEATYTVRKGDTLERIATTYGLRTAELADFNALSDRKVKPGMTLKLPPPPVAVEPAATVPEPASADVYVVRAGDSLSKIARNAGLSDATLMAQNGIRDPNFLYEGQKLKVGKAAAAPTAAPTERPEAEARLAGRHQLAASALLLASPFFFMKSLEFRVDCLATALLALGWALWSLPGRTRGRAALAGACLGLTVLANLRMGPVAVLAAALTLVLDPARGRWGFGRQCGPVAAGSLAVAAAWAAYLGLTGSARIFWQRVITENYLAGTFVLRQEAQSFSQKVQGGLTSSLDPAGIVGQARAMDTQFFSAKST